MFQKFEYRVSFVLLASFLGLVGFYAWVVFMDTKETNGNKCIESQREAKFFVCISIIVIQIIVGSMFAWTFSRRRNPQWKKYRGFFITLIIGIGFSMGSKAFTTGSF